MAYTEDLTYAFLLSLVSAKFVRVESVSNKKQKYIRIAKKQFRGTSTSDGLLFSRAAKIMTCFLKSNQVISLIKQWSNMTGENVATL